MNIIGDTDYGYNIDEEGETLYIMDDNFISLSHETTLLVVASSEAEDKVDCQTRDDEVVSDELEFFEVFGGVRILPETELERDHEESHECHQGNQGLPE